MSAVSVEVVRDGEAVIRLDGIFEVPPSTVFRIEPLDEEGARAGWPAGDLKPMSVRVGERGVELLIGADVVDAPRLLPGTPVAISVPGAALRSELRWPSLPPSKGRRRGAAVVTGEKRAADIAARAEQQRAELARIRAARIAAEREQEAAAEALLHSRRMSASEAIAGQVPALKTASLSTDTADAPAAVAAAPALTGSQTASAPAPRSAAEPRRIAAAIDLLGETEPEAMRRETAPADATGGFATGEANTPAADSTPPPLPAAGAPPVPIAVASAKASGPAAAAERAVLDREPPSVAPPPLPASEPAAGARGTTPDGPEPRDGGGKNAVEVVDGEAPGAEERLATLPDARRSAEEVLSRQVSRRETPTATVARRLQRAFGLGFLAAAALAAIATYVIAPGARPRPADTVLIDQLRAEASGLRARLAGEMEAKRNAETAAETRAIRLEGEIATLRERLLVESRARSGADTATASKLSAAEAEIARQKAMIEAEAERGRAAADALAAATRDLDAARSRLAEAEDARRAAETRAQRLEAEAEQLRVAADSVMKRQAKDGVSAEPATAKPVAANAPPALDPAMKSPAADGKPAAAATSGKAVTLRVNGSEFEVSGTLESFDGKTYVIMTPNVGAMSFDAGRVQCAGVGCPRL